MRTVAIGCRSQLPPGLLDSMHELRNDVFVRRRGWTLQPIPHMVDERDEYDTADAVYLVITDDLARVTACARLLASTGPYMLRSWFPQLLGNSSPPSDPAVWELSRFATVPHADNQGRLFSLSAFTLDLLNVVLHAARQRSAQRLILVTSVAMERLILRARYEVHRMAPPRAVDGALCVALLIEVPETAACVASR